MSSNTRMESAVLEAGTDGVPAKANIMLRTIIFIAVHLAFVAGVGLIYYG